MLLILGKEIVRTHNLVSLLKLLPEVEWDENQLDEAEWLTEWAVEARYPGDWDVVTRDEAARAITIADSFAKITRGYLYEIELLELEEKQSRADSE